MRSFGINGEGELRGQPPSQVHLEKWPLKQSVCVCVFIVSVNGLDMCSHVKLDFPEAWDLMDTDLDLAG